MRTFHKLFLVRLTVTALFLAALAPGLPMQAAAQDTDTSYTNDAHDVTVTWSDEWMLDMTSETDPRSSIIRLERDQSILVIINILDSSSLSPEEAVFVLLTDEDELVEDLSDNDPPRVTFVQADSHMVFVSEAYSLNDGETTVLVIVATIPVLEAPAMEMVQNQVSINGSPVMTGQPLEVADRPEDLTGDPTEESSSRTTRGTDGTPEATEEATAESGRTSRTTRGTDETPEATEEATAESGRTSRTTRGTDETPEATEETTTVVTRTPRTGSGVTETPEATEEAVVTPDPTEEATEEVIESQQADTFTGPVYGYNFEYNPSVWSVADEFETETVDGIRLDAETGTVLFWGVDTYGADPVGCLIGEDEYFFSESESISNWEVAVDTEGSELWFESDDLAWGVFTYTYTTSSGDEVEFVDYISCEIIPGEDAVLIVHLTSLPEDYNINLDHVLDILDTLEFQP